MVKHSKLYTCRVMILFLFTNEAEEFHYILGIGATGTRLIIITYFSVFLCSLAELGALLPFRFFYVSLIKCIVRVSKAGKTAVFFDFHALISLERVFKIKKLVKVVVCKVWTVK